MTQNRCNRNRTPHRKTGGNFDEMTLMDKQKLRQLPVPLLDLSTKEPLTRALPLVFALLDVIVADAFEPEHDDCGFSTMYLAFRSWTELLKLFTSS